MKHTQPKARKQFLLVAFAAATFSFLGALSYVNGTGFISLEGRITPVQSVSRTAAPASGTVKPKLAEGSVPTITKLEVAGDVYNNSAPWSSYTLAAIGHFSDDTQQPVKADWFYKDSNLLTIPNCAVVIKCGINLAGKSTTVVIKYNGVTSERVITVDGPNKQFLHFAPTFSDLIPNWATEHSTVAARLGIMSGYAYGRFGAEDTLTNAQFAVMMSRLYNVAGINTTVDCPSGVQLPFAADHFALSAFCYFISNGHDVSWAINSNEPITRFKTMVMLNELIGEPYVYSYTRNAMGIDRELLEQIFKEKYNNNYTSQENRALIFVDEKKIMEPNNLEKSLNRAEAATVIIRALPIIYAGEYNT